MSLPRVRKRGEGGKTIVKTMRCLLRPGGIGFLNAGGSRVSRDVLVKPTCPVSKNSIHGGKRNGVHGPNAIFQRTAHKRRDYFL